MYRHLRGAPPSHVVTVTSDDDNCANFLSRLPQPLDLDYGMYEVGLLDFRLFQRGSSNSSPADLPLGDAQGTKLFPNLVPPQVDHFKYQYHNKSSILEFIGDFNAQTTAANYPVKIVGYFISKTDLICEIKVTTLDVNEHIVLPPQIAKTLGFRRRCVYLGSFMGEYPVTNDNLKNLQDKVIYNLELVKYPYKDNLINLDRMYTELVSIAFRMQEYREFINKMVEDIRKYGYRLTINFLENGLTEIKYESVNTQDEYVIFPSKLTQCLGFTIQKFNVGTHTSSVPFDSQKFQKFKQFEKFVFEFRRYHTIPLAMDEPSSTDIPTILTTINSTFGKWNYDELRPEFTISDGKIAIANIDPGIRIRLPKILNKFLGIDENAEFNSANHFVLGTNIIEEEKEIEFKETDVEVPVVVPPEPDGDKDILILVDIIQNQMYANKMCPILQQIVWDGKSNIHVSFRSVLYVSLNSEHISFIRVQLRDQYLREIRADNFSAILRLHFKPRL